MYMVGLQGKSAPRAASVTEISKERWIFCLTAFDCSRLGYSDNDQVSGPAEFENFMNSMHVFLSAVGIELLDDASQCWDRPIF